MDYLVIEGYREAAENFARESGLPSPVDLDSIEHRMEIRSAVQRGQVEEAVARVNELNPEVSLCRDNFSENKVGFLFGAVIRQTMHHSYSGASLAIGGG